jgi:hypothetical protein
MVNGKGKAGPSGGSSKSAAPGLGKVDVTFALDDKNTTAKLARVYLPGTTDPENDLANNMDKPKSTLKGQTVGSTFEVVVEASGTPGQKCAFNVTNSEPPVLRRTLKKSGNSASVLITVLGDGE